MRHRKQTAKLGRTSSHREALLSALVNALIEQSRIQTTLAKAKAAGRYAEKMVTLGKKSTVEGRRRALAFLGRKRTVSKLFDVVAPCFSGREGGYTQVIKLGSRSSDGSEMAILKWVENIPSSSEKGVEEKNKEVEPVAD